MTALFGSNYYLPTTAIFSSFSLPLETPYNIHDIQICHGARVSSFRGRSGIRHAIDYITYRVSSHIRELCVLPQILEMGSLEDVSRNQRPTTTRSGAPDRVSKSTLRAIGPFTLAPGTRRFPGRSSVYQVGQSFASLALYRHGLPCR